jgi:hypothetical protein
MSQQRRGFDYSCGQCRRSNIVHSTAYPARYEIGHNSERHEMANVRVVPNACAERHDIPMRRFIINSARKHIACDI